MSMSGLLKFVTGFLLAIALLFFAGVSTTRYLITRLTAPPPRPTFPNDNPTAPPPAVEPSTQAAEPTATPTPAPTPTPLEPGAYAALVTQPIGLVLRQGPGTDTEQIGGIAYNEELVVLETSSDGEWLRIRLEGSTVEGWVKSGNTERLN